LPEKNLVELVNSQPQKAIRLEKAVVKIKNFPIALKWAMENCWVDKRDNEIFLLSYPERFPLQEALEKIARGEEVEESLIKILLQRKLIEKVKSEEEELKKLIGKEVIELTPALLKTKIWKEVKFKPYNVEIAGKRIYPGKKHPYFEFLVEIRQKLVELGFKEMEGPLIETEFWNFDALFQPQDHPARDWFSTFTLSYPKYGKLPKREIVERVKACHENGWKTGSTGWRYKWSHEKASRLMPRAHGTCLSARTLASLPEIPGKYFAIAKCFRPDVIDPMHHIEFNQVEGIVLGESLTFKHLLGVLKMFAEEIAGAKEVRFIPDYYPFTECSVQTSCKHPALGWIEIGGAGIFREEVTYPLGIKVPVIAWGLGIDRLAMFKLNINDIRELLYSRNLDWLRKVPILKR
jgi:phenylalanyl-tRNA synthetase alpha chain